MSGVRRQGRLILLAALAGVVAIVLWFVIGGNQPDEPSAFADAGNATQVAEGKHIYAQACASCHGAALEGQPNWKRRTADGRLPAPPHDAKGHTWHHDDFTLFGITKLGTAAFTGTDYKSDMPAYAESLSDAEIWAVLAYIKSNWPADIQRRQAQVTAQARGTNR